MAAPAIGLAAFLIGAAWPIVRKVLAALGIGFLTYEGLGLIAAQINAQIAEYWGQVGANAMQIMSLGGIPQALGILCGGLTARVSFMAVSKIGKIVS